VVVGLPVCVTDDVDAVRGRAARAFALYGQLPAYRAMLDREGAEGPADVVVCGDEASVRVQLEALEQAGATDFIASEFTRGDEERDRTRTLLASWSEG
jgi:alkanesulfonate monooxygenase SsuD/methylene tetrahydromethanopterin reductase-like flavin-dependent oxidoreductase (luciferase family)